jgi:hypothetical protein
VVDGLYEATEPDTAVACGRFLCGAGGSILPVLFVLAGILIGYLACHQLAAYLRIQRAIKKYKRIRDGAKEACDAVDAAQTGAAGVPTHHAALTILVRSIRKELPAFVKILEISRLPLGAKTPLDVWKKHFPLVNMPIGSALAEIFSADYFGSPPVGLPTQPPPPRQTTRPANTWEAPQILQIRRHRLGDCLGIDPNDIDVHFEAVEANYPVLRPNEMAPVTHTPAVIPYQPLFNLEDRKFLRLIGQTTTMITVNLNGAPELSRTGSTIVCTCGRGGFTSFTPHLNGQATAIEPVQFEMRSDAEENEWIRDAIHFFYKSWTHKSNPSDTPDGLEFLKDLSTMFN